jgi:hypothetical protein
VGINGSHLITAFQCDKCWFRNLKGRDPNNHNTDVLLLVAIRRANLDAMWSLEPGTIENNAREIRRGVRESALVGLRPPYPAMGPWEVGDSIGFGIAIQMLLRSLDNGRRSDYVQYDTVRKLVSAFSNCYHASAIGRPQLVSLAKDKNKSYYTKCEAYTPWNEKFRKGCVKRMGQESRQDKALSMLAFVALMNLLETRLQNASTFAERATITAVGAFCCVGVGGSYRGHEIPLTDLHGLRKYSEEGRTGPDEHVVIPMLGRFKGETGERYHLTPLAAVTKSGIKIRFWVDELVRVREIQGRVNGPAFCDDKTGKPLRARDYEFYFLDALVSIQDARPDLIGAEVNVLEDYGVSRTLRRTAVAQATAEGVSAEDIDRMNRWRSVENAAGKNVNLRMRDHYADIRLLVKALLRFSQAL